MLPREFRNVDESIHAAEVNEGTELDNAGDDSLAHVSWLQVGKEFIAGFALSFFKECTTRQDHVVAVLIEFDDFCFDWLIHIWRKIANTTQLNQ